MNPPKKKFETIDEYIKEFSPEIQKILLIIKLIIRDLAPNAEETISYQIPTFKLNKKNLVHFAAFKKHIGFYPIPSGIEAFKEELSLYESGKGSVKFPLSNPIPFDLIKKMVEFRIKEILDS